MTTRRQRLIALGLALFSAATGYAVAGPVRSVGVMAFADANTLVIADWRASELHALVLPPIAAGVPGAFNLKDVSGSVARALHARPDSLRFEGMAFRPGAELAYLTVSVDHGAKVPEPDLVSVDAKGNVTVVDLKTAAQTSAVIRSAPTADQRFWRDMPEATLTVTDLLPYQGKLYVAGLSNATFASTLRVYDLPFKGEATATSIEMYHAVHNELETRAPIRAMAIATLNGEPSLIAAYTCTPLVTIPLKDLKDGAHITAKTIAELGWGSEPVDMVSFDAGQGPLILLANSHKAADLMSVASIAEAAAEPGLTTPIQWPTNPLLGLKSTYIPLNSVAHLGDQDMDFLGALRRNEVSGAMELVSLRKGAFLRLSDFVNEYDFAGFKYQPGDAFRGLHKVLRTDEGYPELAARTEQ
jgi:hypothetical protein